MGNNHVTTSNYSKIEVVKENTTIPTFSNNKNSFLVYRSEHAKASRLDSKTGDWRKRGYGCLTLHYNVDTKVLSLEFFDRGYEKLRLHQTFYSDLDYHMQLHVMSPNAPNMKQLSVEWYNTDHAMPKVKVTSKFRIRFFLQCLDKDDHHNLKKNLSFLNGDEFSRVDKLDAKIRAINNIKICANQLCQNSAYQFYSIVTSIYHGHGLPHIFTNEAIPIQAGICQMKCAWCHKIHNNF